MPANDKDFSRRIPHTFTAVQWCAIRDLLRLGIYANIGSLTDRTKVVKELLPEIEELVEIGKQLEPIGSGLDHPSKKDW